MKTLYTTDIKLEHSNEVDKLKEEMCIKTKMEICTFKKL